MRISPVYASRPLLFELARRICTPFDQLVDLFTSRWKTVGDAAKVLVKNRLGSDTSLRSSTIQRIVSANSKDDGTVVELLLQLPPEILSQHAAELLQLARCNIHQIAVLKSLPSGWIGMDSATTVARAAMASGDNTVRVAAVSALRLIRQADSNTRT